VQEFLPDKYTAEEYFLMFLLVAVVIARQRPEIEMQVYKDFIISGYWLN